MNKTKLISACCGLALLGGCASFQLGHDFNLEQFANQIQHGVTSQSEVKSWLGTPQSQGVVVDRDGEKLQRWLYYYSQGKLNDISNTRMKTLEVQFDQNGIVRSYNWSGE